MLSKLDVRPADVLTNDRTKAALCTFAGLTCVALSLQSWSSPIYASRCYAFDKGVRERSKEWKILGKRSVVDVSEIQTCVFEMRDAYASGCNLPLENRIASLSALLRMVTENENHILDAVWKDLRRPVGETLYYDILLVQSELRKLIKNLRLWTAPERIAKHSLLTFPSSQWIENEPYGTVLVVGPFNYPFLLTISIVAGAVAAGNNVILKPSNDAPFSSILLEDLFSRYLDPAVVSVVGPRVPGDGIDVMTALLAEKFDFIFFTGSTRVGSIVAQRAGAKLTPYALELGGKNPVFVTPTADLQIAAKQCIWGRILNSGQQCVAPEYVLCHHAILGEFTFELKRWIAKLISDPYSEGCMGQLVGGGPVARNATDRAVRFLDKIGTAGEKLVCGGGYRKELGIIEPTVVICGWDSDLMQDELFCPILCVIPYHNLKDTAVMVRSRPKPLALYIFSRSTIEQRTVLDNTTSGGVTINGVIYHAGHSSLPFGGVGESGSGVYHGRHTIDCFQHKKPVLKKWRGVGDMGIISDPFFIYGPYRNGGMKTRLLRLVGYMS